MAKKKRILKVDENIATAIFAWIDYGIDPGSCARLLLEGKYEEARKAAHQLIRPDEIWADHITFVEGLPPECRGENMKAWKEKHRTMPTPSITCLRCGRVSYHPEDIGAPLLRVMSRIL